MNHTPGKYTVSLGALLINVSAEFVSVQCCVCLVRGVEHFNILC